MKDFNMHRDRFYLPIISAMFAIGSFSLVIIYLLGSSLKEAIYSSVVIVVYCCGSIVAPLLLLRFLYYLILIFRCGLKNDVNIFRAAVLLNPINVVIFPSFLNEQGMSYRRRCIVSLLLLTVLVALVFYLLKLMQKG